MTSIAAVGSQIRSIRKARKLTAPVVAQQAAIHPNTLRKLETGVGNIELNKLLSICDALGLDLILEPKLTSKLRQGDGATSRTALSQTLSELMDVPGKGGKA